MFPNARATAALLACTLSLSSHDASADTIRCIVADARVTLRPDDVSPVLAVLPAGTVLDRTTREGEYYRVTLPPDPAGFLRVGYVKATAAEVVATTPPVAPPTEGMPPASPASIPARTAVHAPDGVAAPAPAAASMTVAVLPFNHAIVEYPWRNRWNVGRGVSELVIDALVNGSSLQVIERDRLAAVLAELELANADVSDASASRVAQLGKLLGARYLVMGSVTRFSLEERRTSGADLPVPGKLGIQTSTAHVRITARLVDTSTGAVLASATGEGDKTRRSVNARGDYTVSSTSSSFRDTVLGEAAEAAVRDCVWRLEAGRQSRRRQ